MMSFIETLKKFWRWFLGAICFSASVITIYHFWPKIENLIDKINESYVIWLLILLLLLIFLPSCIFFFIQNHKNKKEIDDYKKEIDSWGCTFKNYTWYSNDVREVPYMRVRILSMQKILENVWVDPSDISKLAERSILSKLKIDLSKLPDYFSNKLKTIGKKVGENAWNDLLILFDKLKDEDSNDETKIYKWLERELLSGWGDFKYEPTNNTSPDRRAKNGNIVVKNCFLSFKRNDIDTTKKLCPFICGYMEEIITKIYEDRVTVTTENPDCRCIFGTGNEERTCRFTIKPS